MAARNFTGSAGIRARKTDSTDLKFSEQAIDVVSAAEGTSRAEIPRFFARARHSNRFSYFPFVVTSGLKTPGTSAAFMRSKVAATYTADTTEVVELSTVTTSETSHYLVVQAIGGVDSIELNRANGAGTPP